MSTEATTALPVIYCFINSGAGTDWVCSIAMAEDGTCLGQHVSSSDEWARLDIGYEDVRGPAAAKRARFAEHYPDGFRVEWVDDPRSHEGLMAAYALNQAAAVLPAKSKEME